MGQVKYLILVLITGEINLFDASFSDYGAIEIFDTGFSDCGAVKIFNMGFSD